MRNIYRGAGTSDSDTRSDRSGVGKSYGDRGADQGESKG